MRYGSVCSGIEAASVAWHPLGWRASWLAEIEAFPAAVLAHHYPEVPNLGDMTTIARRVMTGEVDAPDVLVGGTPCQAFSVAGLRQSLADARGNLTLKFVELADAVDHVRAARGEQPAIIVWENVPGVLNTPDNAFGCFLGALAGEDCELQPAGKRWSDAGCVYGPARAVAWRILDAQYFGLAQRRRRVFVVASARNGFDPAAVLFEFDGVRRDSAPRREAGKGSAGRAARSVALRGREGGGTAELGDELQNCLRASGGGGDKPHVLIHADPIARCVTAGEAKRQDWETCNFVAHSLRGEGFDASEGGTGRGTPLVPVLGSRHNSHWNGGPHPPLSQSSQTRCGGIGGSNQELFGQGGAGLAPVVGPMTACGGTEKKHGFGWGQQDWENGYCQPTPAMQVRRLTPRECERLQGFPDDWTLVPVRGKPAADGPRYKALGNSMAVPVMRWIGRRISDAIHSPGGGA